MTNIDYNDPIQCQHIDCKFAKHSDYPYLHIVGCEHKKGDYVKIFYESEMCHHITVEIIKFHKGNSYRGFSTIDLLEINIDEVRSLLNMDRLPKGGID